MPRVRYLTRCGVCTSSISPCAIVARPLICFRKSVAPGHKKIRIAVPSRNILVLPEDVQHQAQLFWTCSLRNADPKARGARAHGSRSRASMQR